MFLYGLDSDIGGLATDIIYKMVSDRRWRRHDPIHRLLYALDTVINRMQQRLLVGQDGFASGDVSENLRQTKST